MAAKSKRIKARVRVETPEPVKHRVKADGSTPKATKSTKSKNEK